VLCEGLCKRGGGALAVAAGAALVGLAAPEIATVGLFVAGAVGTGTLVVSAANHYLDGNRSGLAYDAGSALGGILAGGATAFGVRFSITGERNLPTSFGDFMGKGKTTEFDREGQTAFDAIRAAFSKGPDLGGAGLGVAAGGAGASVAMGCS